MSSGSKQRPIRVYKDGGLEVSKWAHNHDGRISYSFSFQKSYKDRNGNWQHTNFYDSSDLFRFMGILMKALVELVAVRENLPETPPVPPPVAPQVTEQTVYEDDPFYPIPEDYPPQDGGY